MFKKAFNIKSNTNLRNSDCRKLLKRVEPNVAEALPKKATVSHVKITTFNEAQLNVYSFDKVPMFFDDNPDGYLVPTVYATWTHPECCPILVVHQEVFGYLENGADLMLQGVIVNSTIQLPTFDRGVPVAIATLGKDGLLRGPLAIGASVLSSEMMKKCGMQGKGVQLMHIFRDVLWEMGPRTQPPLLDLSVLQRQLKFPSEIVNQVENLSIRENDNGDPESSNQPSSLQEEGKEDEGKAFEEEDTEAPEDLLMRCFLAGLRYRLGKSANLPDDVGQFYSCCLLKCVPEGKRLDVKKTKFKKFATFLTEINKHDHGSLLKITSKGKGADVIAEVNWEHPLLTRFKLSDEKTKDEITTGGSAAPKGPQINEYYTITEALVPLLKARDVQYNRGDLIQTAEVREIVTAYVKKENLNDGKMIKLDPLLSSITGISQEKTDWNTIIQKVVNRLTKTFVIKMPDGRQIVRKLKMPTIVFKVETRSGNKKVTLVNNLAAFGLEPKEIAHTIQVGVAASATLGDAPCCEGFQVTVQGNQVAFIGDLLMRIYGIDRRYIEGLELAPKKKK